MSLNTSQPNDLMPIIILNQQIPSLMTPTFSNNETSEKRTENDNYTYLTRQLIEKKRKAIDFEKNLLISKEDFNSAIALSNHLIQSFKPEFVYEICKLTKLTSLQTNLLEILIYLLGYDYFDWNHMIDQLIYELRSKMSKVTYEHISMSKLNYLLNKFCINEQFPKYITPFSMNYLYQWVKCQIKIVLFKFQHKSVVSTKGKEPSQAIAETPRSPQGNKSISYKDGLTTRNSLKKSGSQKPLVKEGGGKSRSIIQKQILQLNEYNFQEEKEKKESASIRALPLLYNRSYNQMRKVYAFPLNHMIENVEIQHSNQLKSVSIKGINDRNKFINWISTKKAVALNGLPQYKVRKLFKSDYD